MDHITEDHPYAQRRLDAYTDTKIKGEQLVLGAGSRAGSKLATCALRPSYVYGEGDALFLPSIARRGVEVWGFAVEGLAARDRRERKADWRWID